MVNITLEFGIGVIGMQAGQPNTVAVTTHTSQGVEIPASDLISQFGADTVNVAALTGLSSPAGISVPVISFPVAPGHTYQVQASVNLATWSTIWQTNATNNAWTQVGDVDGANLTMRFYRVAWQ